MATYNVLIAEDHEEIREILSAFVDLHTDFEVTKEIDDGAKLLETVNKHKPDLLLVDISMPCLNGVQAIRECLEVYPRLAFIFVTAYDGYAAEAFELNAIDYIVKPVQKKRVFAALEKAKMFLPQGSGAQTANVNKKVEVRFGREIYFIDLQDILFVEKVARKLYIHTSYKIYETISTLEQFAKQLTNQFIMSHRSSIINVKNITHIQLSGNAYLAYFANYQTPAPISKQKVDKVKESIKQIM
ncbi:LytR/AlgR family response regulator transcription factor [Pontibacillus yanchengensis]|uniref:LytTR family transcriptional regulator n=1 Tax=Pontibacillus yanchengensis Y32 TaxID=1385514 RepID=A0A0A2TG57_9BACI|nr:LytTR family DNA-binding domain-containing protein [Pontibacillus yanchengensis]KGP74544.1 LytTR family transcriptional regulator [Pontibacillus yanchengensis Y32]